RGGGEDARRGRARAPAWHRRLRLRHRLDRRDSGGERPPRGRDGARQRGGAGPNRPRHRRAQDRAGREPAEPHRRSPRHPRFQIYHAQRHRGVAGEDQRHPARRRGPDHRPAARPPRPFRGPRGLPGERLLGDVAETEGRGRLGDPRRPDRKDDDVKRVDWKEPGALARPAGRSDPALQAAVRAIVEDVRARGWEALAEQALRLDGEAPTLVEVAPIAAEARRSLAASDVAAIELAARNIEAFHKGGLPAEHAVETMPGLTVRKVWRAVDRVGLYVPGGKTPLFSTLMMLALPARAAGVREIVAVTPPRPEGGLDPLVALAAELCGIEAMWT